MNDKQSAPDLVYNRINIASGNHSCTAWAIHWHSTKNVANCHQNFLESDSKKLTLAGVVIGRALIVYICAFQMTIEAAREAFCEKESEHFGVSPFSILDAIGARIVERYASMVEGLQGEGEKLGLNKAQLESVFMSI